ncbi:uncharacterized protein LOC106159203 [Lingula anatina]|uniref:Uncharacterized protein LOC106159203 n=1 Tax=Lingula anatina TaxID=7574 RepID=A0A1S3HXW9_LINAN|nr:uncharacterized protein LOC106159203 [Lingula anatina]|eukprot:XP_013390875.1 uncharacterized protein LOC106159203 [Lingula anatina]
MLEQRQQTRCSGHRLFITHPEDPTKNVSPLVTAQMPPWTPWSSSLILFVTLASALGHPEQFEDYLLCRHCGHEVAKASHLLHVPSPLALRQRNDTILGVKEVLIQLFQNPQGSQFEIIAAQKADVYKLNKAFIEHSWFPGLTWRVTVCPRCGHHLGWFFEPHTHDLPETYPEAIKDGFAGLILENLLHQDFADSLLITPKSYLS